MGSMNLSEIKLAGIKDMYAKHESEESKGVKVHFKLDESGIVKLDKVSNAEFTIIKKYLIHYLEQKFRSMLLLRKLRR